MIESIIVEVWQVSRAGEPAPPTPDWRVIVARLCVRANIDLDLSLVHGHDHIRIKCCTLQ